MADLRFNIILLFYFSYGKTDKQRTTRTKLKLKFNLVRSTCVVSRNDIHAEHARLIKGLHVVAKMDLRTYLVNKQNSLTLKVHVRNKKESIWFGRQWM